MLIKSADDRQADLDTLETLEACADSATKKRIAKERKAILSGVKGEKEAAYYINFHWQAGENWAVIHDLRLEHDGRVAQIDHLIINRLLDVFVIESKNFGTGIGINDHGECVAFYGRFARGIPSPFAQNARHVDFLEHYFRTGPVQPPRRLGLTIKPRLWPRVLVSAQSRISRPKGASKDADTILKADQIQENILKAFDQNTANPLVAARIVSRDTLRQFAECLVAQHKPASFDWAARFGIASIPVAEPEAAKSPSAKSGECCAACGAEVSEKVVAYCQEKDKRFRGFVFCYGCQRDKAMRQPVFDSVA